MERSSDGSSREKPVFLAAIHEIIRRLWPQSPYTQRTLFPLINGYVFHIGLAIVVFLMIFAFKNDIERYWDLMFG